LTLLLLSRHANVLILTTSNITGVIDVAFLDRADVRQYIGLPSSGAIYQILYSCIQELIRVCHILSLHSCYHTGQAKCIETWVSCWWD